MQLKFLMLVAAVFGSVLAVGAARAAEPGFYEAELEVADQTAATRRNASRAGLEQVLIRLSGVAPLPAGPVLQEALSQPERYYDRYLFVADDRLKLFFTPSAVLELIDQAKLPLWPAHRPHAIAWVALEENGVRQIVRGGHPLALALVAEARQRGFEVRLPLMDLRDQLRVQPVVVWGRASLVLAEASRRYGTAAMLIGRLRQQGSKGWSGDFSHWQGGAEFIDQIRGLDLFQAGVAGANFLANAMATRGAIPWRPAEPNLVIVNGIATPFHYGGLLRHFASLEYLTAVSVVGLDHDRMEVQLSSRAEEDRLLALLQADGRLAGPAPGAPANQLTWRGADLDRPSASQWAPVDAFARRSSDPVSARHDLAGERGGAP